MNRLTLLWENNKARPYSKTNYGYVILDVRGVVFSIEDIVVPEGSFIFRKESDTFQKFDSIPFTIRHLYRVCVVSLNWKTDTVKMLRYHCTLKDLDIVKIYDCEYTSRLELLLEAL